MPRLRSPLRCADRCCGGYRSQQLALQFLVRRIWWLMSFMTEAPSRRWEPAVYPPAENESDSTPAQEKLEDVQVILKQLRPHFEGFADRKPARFLGIVATTNLRQLARREVVVKCVGDSAAAQ